MQNTTYEHVPGWLSADGHLWTRSEEVFLTPEDSLYLIRLLESLHIQLTPKFTNLHIVENLRRRRPLFTGEDLLVSIPAPILQETKRVLEESRQFLRDSEGVVVYIYRDGTAKVMLPAREHFLDEEQLVWLLQKHEEEEDVDLSVNDAEEGVFPLHELPRRMREGLTPFDSHPVDAIGLKLQRGIIETLLNPSGKEETENSFSSNPGGSNEEILPAPIQYTSTSDLEGHSDLSGADESDFKGAPLP